VYVKWFGQVIVRAHIQSMYPIFHVIAGGQNQHRHIIFAVAQTAENISAIHIRQTHIQNNHIKLVCGQQLVGSFAIIFVRNCIPRPMERMKQDISLQRIVFNDKNTHSRNPFRLA
jgi:hypothetical protein